MKTGDRVKFRIGEFSFVGVIAGRTFETTQWDVRVECLDPPIAVLDEKDLELLGASPAVNSRPLVVGDKVRLQECLNVPPYFKGTTGIVTRIAEAAPDSPWVGQRMLLFQPDGVLCKPFLVFEIDAELVAEASYD